MNVDQQAEFAGLADEMLGKFLNGLDSKTSDNETIQTAVEKYIATVLTPLFVPMMSQPTLEQRAAMGAIIINSIRGTARDLFAAALQGE